MATAPIDLKESRRRVWFGAAPVDVLGMDEAAEAILRTRELRRSTVCPEPVQVMGPNAFLVTLAAANTSFAKALRRADFCLPDGMSVVWGARLLGATIRERVPGGELMERLCALGAGRGLSIYLLGGLPGAASAAARVLVERYPGLRIAGTDCPEPGFEQDHEANETVRARIIAARPDLLFIALGAPKQEVWMLDECPTLPAGVAMSVGAAFDTLAGLRKRAPVWTHDIGAEWLYRLVMEPRRLWKRYLIGNARFLGITIREALRVRRVGAEGGPPQGAPVVSEQAGAAESPSSEPFPTRAS